MHAPWWAISLQYGALSVSKLGRGLFHYHEVGQLHYEVRQLLYKVGQLGYKNVWPLAFLVT